MRLIDADALWAEFMELADTSIEFDGEGVANAIANAPTVDAVEVVRCKDCKAYDKESYYCEAMGFTCEANDFCSYGERKDNDIRRP